MATGTGDTLLNMENSESDELHFQDIPHTEPLLDEEPKLSGGKSKIHTHTFTNFPDQDSDEDEADKTDLLEGEKKQLSFWTFEYYQQFFDVDSKQVFHRIAGSMIPNPRGTNYLQLHIRPKPDLYGPFWICTTLVFTTAIAGNFANYMSTRGDDYDWHYDFKKVTFAASAIFTYWWVIPTLLWLLLWWRGSQAGYSFLEMVCVYGYSLAIYIPISVLWLIPYWQLQYTLVVVGMLLSGGVLALVFWPAVKNDDRKIAFLTMCLILLFHGALAVGFVLYFFQVQPASLSTTLPGNYTTAMAPTTESANDTKRLSI